MRTKLDSILTEAKKDVPISFIERYEDIYKDIMNVFPKRRLIQAYATDEERIKARKKSQREYYVRWRDKKRAEKAAAKKKIEEEKEKANEEAKEEAKE
jgi:hypothetical protein